MQAWICQHCKGTFHRWNRRSKPHKFCTPRCYQEWLNAGNAPEARFRAGMTPWNKDTKGIMQVNSGSFRRGHKLNTEYPVGATRVRIDKGGRPRTWVKVSDDTHSSYDWKLRAVIVWTGAFGEVPHNCVVHHKDRDTLNDALENLELQTRSQHLKEHRHEFEAARRNSLVARVRDSTAPETSL